MDLSNSISYYGDFFNTFFENGEPLGEQIKRLDHLQLLNSNETTLEDYEYLRPIVDRYFKLKPEIKNKIYNIDYSNYLGVHIRGLDKKSETELKDCHNWHIQILKSLPGHSGIYLATDDIKYYNYFLDVDLPIQFSSCFKTNKNNNFDSRFGNKDGLKSAEDALIDCYRLGSCKSLIRTKGSNLSSWSIISSDKIKNLVQI